MNFSWEICMQVKKQQLELDKEKQTGSKLGKECVKAVYCHPAYLTYMQSISCKMPVRMKHKLESRLPGDIHSYPHWESLLKTSLWVAMSESFSTWSRIWVPVEGSGYFPFSNSTKFYLNETASWKQKMQITSSY